jgi:hypothetical protein
MKAKANTITNIFGKRTMLKSSYMEKITGAFSSPREKQAPRNPIIVASSLKLGKARPRKYFRQAISQLPVDTFPLFRSPN